MEIDKVEKPYKVSLKQTKIKELEIFTSVLAFNTKYIISRTINNSIIIEDIVTSLSFSLNSDNIVSIVKFHPNLENVFLLIENNIMKIYQIMEDNFECKEKVKVSGNTGQVSEAIFSNTDYNSAIVGFLLPLPYVYL